MNVRPDAVSSLEQEFPEAENAGHEPAGDDVQGNAWIRQLREETRHTRKNRRGEVVPTKAALQAAELLAAFRRVFGGEDTTVVFTWLRLYNPLLPKQLPSTPGECLTDRHYRAVLRVLQANRKPGNKYSPVNKRGRLHFQQEL